MIDSISRREIIISGGFITASTVVLENHFKPTSFSFPETAPNDWPAKRRDPRRRAATPEADPPSSSPTTDWVADGASTVVVGGGVVFAGDRTGTRAIDRESGTQLWEATVPGEQLCYQNHSIYCANSDGLVAKLNSKTGERNWKVTPDRSISVHDLLIAGPIVFVGEDGALTARHAGSGRIRWRLDVGHNGAVFPAIADDTLYLGGPGPFEVYYPRKGLSALLHEGPRLSVHSYWEAEQVEYPVAGERAIYAGSTATQGSEPTVQAFTANGVDRLWNTVHGRSVSSPALADGIGVVTLSVRDSEFEHRLLGIDLETGSTHWNKPWDTTLTRPVVAGHLAIVGDSGGSIVAIDPETGATAWETNVDAGVRTIVPTGERILVVDDQNRLWCLR